MFFVLLLIVSFSVFKSENLNFPDSIEFYDPRTKRLLYSLASSAGISGYFNLEESEDESVRKNQCPSPFSPKSPSQKLLGSSRNAPGPH